MSEKVVSKPDSGGEPTDEQLWSWVDRAAPELDAYLAAHPEAVSRVGELRAAIGRVEAADSELQLPEQIGEYKVTGLLGRGGMGFVYDAVQTHPSRRVALKVLPVEVAADERRLELFRREADALARLSHPGIAVIYAAGHGQDGRPHIAMERIVGRHLDAYASEERLSRRQRVTLVQKVCEAIGHAHDQGIVHRDLKPTNVLVDAHGKPVVVDFGLARIQAEQLSVASQAGSLLGTLPYMSPEQVSGRLDVGPRSDVYSLGVLLYELVTGKLPYALGELSLVEAARRIEQDPPRLRGAAARALRGDLRTVVLNALEKDPRQRYASAGELAADLLRYLEGRSIEAVRPPLTRRAVRFVRRHKLATSFFIVVGIAALLLVLPLRLPIPLVGGWWRVGAPFEDVRWVRDSPEVQVDGEWYALVAIDDLRSAYMVGFCQQTERRAWRKRFSEELVQVLNRLGHWAIGPVDLTLRDLETGNLLIREDVPLNSKWRASINMRRNSWPWTAPAGTGTDVEGVMVRYLGRDMELLRVDDVLVSEFEYGLSYDSYCDRMGRSPGERIDFVLRDPQTGGLHEIDDVYRLGTEPFP
jgi:serine/threonine protein kinase